MSTTGGRSASAAPSHICKAFGEHRNHAIGCDVIAKACLRQGSFAPGNPGMSTTGGRSASAAPQSQLQSF